MSKNTLEVYRKISKWTDDIKKDNKYYGVGTVNNQIHLPNGAKIERPCEDRSFSYEFKENEIYAYGLLDGYNGTWAVDLVDQCILTNMYFDHLSNLKSSSDQEIYDILRAEFQKTEQTLQENLEDLLMKRASRTVYNGELRKGTVEYMENMKEIKYIDSQINSGAFALVTLIVDKRLFVANVGTSHCFVCVNDKKNNEKKVVSIGTEHSISNIEEMMRLIKLKANIDPNSLSFMMNEDSQIIKYTRCLGDFKIKLYYHEYPQFKDCTEPPFLSIPDYPSHSLLIDDSYLFMVMYSDALAKAIEFTDLTGENTDAKIAKMLIGKIINEQTLNSAAQSVLDEIKRAYDDKFVSTYSERDDFTLVVRVFDANIKNRLIQLENYGSNNSTASSNDANSVHNNGEVKFIEANLESLDEEVYDSLQSSNAFTSSLTMSNNLTSTSLTYDDSRSSTYSNKTQDPPIETLFDENGKVKTYVDFQELEELLKDDETKRIFDEFNAKLMALAEEPLPPQSPDQKPELSDIIENTRV